MCRENTKPFKCSHFLKNLVLTEKAFMNTYLYLCIQTLHILVQI